MCDLGADFNRFTHRNPPSVRKGERDTMMGFGLIFLILIVVAIVWGLRWMQQEGQLPESGAGPRSRSDSPLDILKERYARGEISQAEYERMREDLRT
jgi:putative membrane protein